MPRSRFRKGQLVRVVPPHGPWQAGTPALTRLTEAERTEMYSLPYYREMGDDGESRLVPHFVHCQPTAGSILTVLRARVAYPGPMRRKGYVHALSTTMGRELWIHESMLQPIE